MTEFEKCGGPAIDVTELKLHLLIYIANMGLTWMLDAPRLILLKVPDVAEAKDRQDPIIQNSERGRSQLLIMSAFLNPRSLNQCAVCVVRTNNVLTPISVACLCWYSNKALPRPPS